MWKKNESTLSPQATSPSLARTPPSARTLASIGPSIFIKGDLSGEEDLRIDGRLEGKVTLRKHNITVGSGGRVSADLYGRRIRVEGTVEGNLFGEEEVVICESGKVEGNITAPQVSLEKGSNFKGSIDMGSPAGTRQEPPAVSTRAVSAGVSTALERKPAQAGGEVAAQRPVK